MEVEYILLILGFILTVMKEIFRTEKDDGTSNVKALTRFGRIAMTIAVLLFVVGLLSVYQSNAEKNKTANVHFPKISTI